MMKLDKGAWREHLNRNARNGYISESEHTQQACMWEAVARWEHEHPPLTRPGEETIDPVKHKWLAHNGMLPLNIEVNDLTGRRACLQLLGNKSILELKQQLENSFQVPIENQRVIFEGEELSDANKTLQQYQVSNNGKLVLGRMRRQASSQVKSIFAKPVS